MRFPRRPIELRGVLRQLTSRLSERASEETGAVAIIVALLALVFIGLAAIAVDIARVYVEAERVQKTADAAALAGVTYMPMDLPAAQTAARDAAKRNGYTPSGDVVMTAERADKPSQLRVTISSTVDSGFAGVFGITSETVTRQATADYQGPIPMASPCNTMGNEPTTTKAGPRSTAPAGSVLPVTSGCTQTPMFWAAIEGPNTDKGQGDRFMTRLCDADTMSGGIDGCSGNFGSGYQKNDEFDPQGYFYKITVNDPAATGPITVQLYDPAYIYTDTDCSEIYTGWTPWTWWIKDKMNDYAYDGLERYDNDNTRFCAGDNNPGGYGSSLVATSFALRAPTDTGDPKHAPVIGSCIAQFKGRDDDWGDVWDPAGDLKQTNELTSIFHQWVPLCTITNPVKGDYYLQVRTNVALPSMSSSQYIARGNMAVVNQTGDDTNVKGVGSNGYAIRLYSSNGAKVSVSGYERMPIYANSPNQDSTFHLVKAMPGAAGKTIEFSFYDAADTSSSGSVTVLAPADATGSIRNTTSIQGCTGQGVVNGNLTGCSVAVRNSRNDGRLQTMYIPVPSDYNCDYLNATGCWFKVRINFPGAQVTDFTTWTSKLLGDPVRLVR